MPFLSEADQDQLRDIFQQQLDGHVRIRLFTEPSSKLFVPGTQPCLSCQDAEYLLDEVAALSDRLEVVVHDVKADPGTAEAYGVSGLLPALVLEPASADDGAPAEPMGRVRFLGLPAGYEFSTLVTDILDLSNHRVDLSPEAQTELRSLEQDVHLQVFVTPT